MDKVNALQDMSSPASSYASVTQKENFPMKEHAIVLDAYEDITIKDYILGIGKALNSTNIRFASRIANNRICIYFAGKTFVDKLTSGNSNIFIKDRLISVRPLIMKIKRIILSNVCPIIPHNVILDAFKQMGNKTVSPFSFIRIRFIETGFTHKLSFCRQVYIHPDDVNKLPENLQVNYDETSYWILISTDNLKCFQCKREGHLAKHCPNSTLPIQVRDTNKEDSFPPLTTEK